MNIDSFENGSKKNKPIKLNLGCFNRKIYGFVNVDIRENIQPDVVDDISKLEKFEDNTVDLVYACHCLEHLTFENAEKALKRWFQVLKYGGKVRISVPDMERHVSAYFWFKDLRRLRSGFWRLSET